MKFSIAPTVFSLAFVASSSAFVPAALRQNRISAMKPTFMTIVSPFDDSQEHPEGAPVATKTESSPSTEGPLDLTWENVETVLDEMRPYLIQDGGNVSIDDIDGPVVKLKLEVSL